MIRAFLGIALPADVRSALMVQQFLLPLPRKVDPGQFHLTLVFLGEVPGPVLEAAHDGFLALRAAPFPLALKGIGHFGGERPRAVWAGVAPSKALMRLHAKADHIARRAGCPLESRRFLPHVTLGRFAPPALAEAMTLERAIAEGAAFATAPWQVTELTLWQSHLGPKGPRHEVLATYPLAG